MIVPLLQYKYSYHIYKNTSMTNLAAQATLHTSPVISYFVLLHPAFPFLQDRKIRYFLSYQVSNFQIIPSFPSTSSFSALNKSTSLLDPNYQTMAPVTRSISSNNNSTSSTNPKNPPLICQRINLKARSS